MVRILHDGRKEKADGIRYLIGYSYTIPYESSAGFIELPDVLFTRNCVIFRSARTEPTNRLNLNACELLVFLSVLPSAHAQSATLPNMIGTNLITTITLVGLSTTPPSCVENFCHWHLEDDILNVSILVTFPPLFCLMIFLSV
mgnify:CR=1 FL=1